VSEPPVLWPNQTPEDLKRLIVLKWKADGASGAMMLLQKYEKLRLHTDNHTQAELENLAGVLFLELNRPSEAKDYFNAALKHDPSLPSARRNLENMERRYDQQY
jgi:hypothetical protein